MDALAGFAFGLAIAVITTPVGVSGAVFLLPVQLSVLSVPSPSVNPTNLLYNVVAVPGALLRYRRVAPLRSPLATLLVFGSVPGVVLGASIRVLLIPGGTIFRVLLAVLLLPLGLWLIGGDRAGRQASSRTLAPGLVTGLAFAAGLLGGIYGIGGGALLAPILVGSGYLLAEVAPAALVSTFLTSCVGALSYAILAIFGHPAAAPDWALGLVCGLGGLLGGYVGAGLQPRIPQRALRALLGGVAVALAIGYLVAVAR